MIRGFFKKVIKGPLKNDELATTALRQVQAERKFS